VVGKVKVEVCQKENFLLVSSVGNWEGNRMKLERNLMPFLVRDFFLSHFPKIEKIWKK
jgi:hypothetical protein